MTSGEDGDDKTYERDFVEIYRNNRQMFYLTARKYVGKHEAAEDAVQSAFADLWYRRSRGEIIDDPIAYVHGTIVHKALDGFRKQMREKRMSLRNSECEQIPTPESVPEVDDRIEYVRAAMEKMKPQLTRILHLCCIEKKPCHVVAKMLGKPLGTVHVSLWRAKFQLTRLIRMQEKRDEAQKNKNRGISKPGFAGSSGA